MEAQGGWRWKGGMHVWRKQSSGSGSQGRMRMEEVRDHTTRSFVGPINEHGLYPEGKGEERRDVGRHAFWKHHCGCFTHSRQPVLWRSAVFVNLVRPLMQYPFPQKQPLTGCTLWFWSFPPRKPPLLHLFQSACNGVELQQEPIERGSQPRVEGITRTLTPTAQDPSQRPLVSRGSHWICCGKTI